MKKQTIIVWVAMLTYSFLFYQQSAGLNFLLFNALLLGLLTWQQPHLWRSVSWVCVAIGSLVASGNIVWQHTNLAVVAHVLSMAAVAGMSLSPKSSLLVAIADGAYSLLGAILLRLSRTFEQTESQSAGKISGFAYSLKRVVPPLLTVVFFLIYRAANPAFRSITDGYFSGWLSSEWLLFTLPGFLYLFPFFNPVAIEPLHTWDEQSSDWLTRTKNRLRRNFRLNGLRTEYRIGWLSFALLNGLLLLVNATDAYYLFVAQTLPDGVAYADYVHQGVYALIFSIVLAIGIMLYFFRGNLNFYTGNWGLKWLAYGWILQNLALVGTTIVKTNLYVAEFGLTHKRIGVWVYLLLTAIGLLLTVLKIQGSKSNWFLFRKTTWAFYTVLLLATFVNWDRVIARYNVAHLQAIQKIDVAYLLQLSDSVLPELTQLGNQFPQIVTERERTVIRQREQTFIQHYPQQSWQSWNYDDFRVYHLVKNTR